MGWGKKKRVEIMLKERTGFATITYKLRLYDRHQDWLLLTRQVYNRVVWHYYQILMQERLLLEKSNFLLLRKLEELSVGTREMKERGEEPVWKLEGSLKVPLYFRRAAINTAIGLARGYVTSCDSLQGKQGMEKEVSQATRIDCSPVLYKGMYREFCGDSIEIKVFNGKKWIWIRYPYTGRNIPKEGQILSPTLKVEKKEAYLHVPVELEVKDIRTVRKRVEEEELICAVAFPDNDTLAVCVVMEMDGRVKKVQFLHGGKAREAQRNRVLRRLEKSKKSRQCQENKKDQKDRDQENKKENQYLYQKLEQINQYYAHKISREILNFCKEQEVKLIVVPNYKESIPFQERPYLHTNLYHWQGRAMIRKLRYKSFREGILVTSIPSYHIADCCSECGRKIQRYNEGHKASRNYYGGQLFFCSEGHKGNTALNTAKNIGRYFLKHFQERTDFQKRTEMDFLEGTERVLWVENE